MLTQGLAARRAPHYGARRECAAPRLRGETLMPFAAGLRESLEIRESEVPFEFTRGDSLEHVLSKHLLAIEQNSDRELISSILLLSSDGKRLSHGAAPSLPKAYCAAIDGSEIGPRAGSCGTAAFFGRPVYVTDIATDPLWADYRHIALPHGLRSCWSTPIRDTQGAVIGTFAIYHRAVTGPTRAEVEAIGMITGHAAHAIMWARGIQDVVKLQQVPRRQVHHLKLIADNDPALEAGDLAQNLLKLELLASDMDREAAAAESGEAKAGLKTAAEDTRALIEAVRRQIELLGGAK